MLPEQRLIERYDVRIARQLVLPPRWLMLIKTWIIINPSDVRSAALLRARNATVLTFALTTSERVHSRCSRVDSRVRSHCLRRLWWPQRVYWVSMWNAAPRAAADAPRCIFNHFTEDMRATRCARVDVLMKRFVFLMPCMAMQMSFVSYYGMRGERKRGQVILSFERTRANKIYLKLLTLRDSKHCARSYLTILVFTEWYIQNNIFMKVFNVISCWNFLRDCSTADRPSIA